MNTSLQYCGGDATECLKCFGVHAAAVVGFAAIMISTVLVIANKIK